MSDFQSMSQNISHKRYLINRPCVTPTYHNCDMETFADRVRQTRKRAGMTQKELAAKSGLSQTTISDIERGRNETSAAAVALGRALKVFAEWLTDGKGPRNLEEATTPNTATHAGEPDERTQHYIQEAIFEALTIRESELSEQLQELTRIWLQLTPQDRTATIARLRRKTPKPEIRHTDQVTAATEEVAIARENPEWHSADGGSIDLYEKLQSDKKKTPGGKPRVAK